MFEIEFRTYIKNAFETDNVHWVYAPEETPNPVVILNVIGVTADYTMEGLNDFGFKTVQVDIYSTDLAEILSLRSKLVSAIKAGNFGEMIGGIFIKNERQGIDTSTNEPLFRYSIDLDVAGNLI